VLESIDRCGTLWLDYGVRRRFVGLHEGLLMKDACCDTNIRR
jgi:hypothetical protein